MPSHPSTRTHRPTLGVFFCTALLVLTQALAPRPAWSATDPGGNLVFILDASGSMSAKVQGQPKIQIAKTVLTDLIADLPAGTQVGLVAYGHRQKDDCQDVEELATLGPLDKKTLTAKLQALAPKGKTPITDSVRMVAEGLKTREDATTIVLVSDGEETCNGDPCALVKELKASGIKFVMHVVGFDVAEKEKAQLACIAAAGGGTYFTAKNAGELASAAKRIAAPTTDSGGRLKVTALRNGKPVGAYYQVFKSGQDLDTDKESLASNPIGDDGETIKLAPGVYDLKITNQEDAGNPAQTFSAIHVEAGKVVEKIADFSGGNLKVKALRNGRPAGAAYQVFKSAPADAEERESVAANPIGDEGETIKLLPGSYDLEITDYEDAGNPLLKFPGIVIKAGKTVQQIAEFSGGSLRVKVRKGGKPVGGWYDVFKAGSTGDEERQSVASNPIGDDGETIKLPAGTYDLDIKNMDDAANPVAHFPGIVIEAGRVVERSGEF
ncbi:VWA domain-containing protein [uncultured Thiodictyon sp.]|uniref:vWA domain-containing protein n=1 Tax=uncultured Thiodictyon sp. TaxID=1846217 RepID=UPI0025F4E59F|nr:VWA domain-containing protein [uncultured Thiodictyon sp.]